MFGTISVEDFSVPHGSTDWDWLDRSPHSFSKIIQFPVKSSSCSSNSNTATTICLTSSKMITVHKRMNSFQSSVQSIQLESPVTVIAQAQAKNCTFGIHRYTETLSLIASGHQNGYISIFHGDSTQLLTRLISHTGPVFGLKFINGNDEGKKTQIISISQDRTAKVWEGEDNGFNMCQTIPFDSPILCLAISPCETMVSLGGLNQKLSIYKRDISKGRVNLSTAKALKHHAHNVVAIKFWPDSTMLISGSSDGTVVFMDTWLHKVKQIISLHLPPLPQYVFPSQIVNIALSRYGHLVSLSDTGVLNTWNPLDFNGDKDILNVSPIDEMLMEKDKSCRSCDFVNGETAILVPNLASSHAKVISIQLPVPSLKHLARICIRRQVLDPTKLEALRLPRSLIAYLSYDVWV